MTTATQLLQVIDKWKVNRALLASKMNMPKGTFNNKLSDAHTAYFTDKELNQLCNILIELRADLAGIESADFNEGLKILTNATI